MKAETPSLTPTVEQRLAQAKDLIAYYQREIWKLERLIIALEDAKVSVEWP